MAESPTWSKTMIGPTGSIDWTSRETRDRVRGFTCEYADDLLTDARRYEREDPLFYSVLSLHNMIMTLLNMSEAQETNEEP